MITEFRVLIETDFGWGVHAGHIQSLIEEGIRRDDRIASKHEGCSKNTHLAVNVILLEATEASGPKLSLPPVGE